jgi:uncharacterized membrane protein YgdD (TMEM256/DUF423 family)
MSAQSFHGKKRTVTCTLFLTGMILFCGTCYLIVFLDEKKPYSSVTPYGGMCLMAGWLAIALFP